MNFAEDRAQAAGDSGSNGDSVLARLHAFLPELRKANEELEASTGNNAQCDAHVFPVEAEEEDDDEDDEDEKEDEESVAEDDSCTAEQVTNSGSQQGHEHEHDISSQAVVMDLGLGVFDVNENDAANQLHTECEHGPAALPVTQPDLLASGHLRWPKDAAERNFSRTSPVIEEQEQKTFSQNR